MTILVLVIASIMAPFLLAIIVKMLSDRFWDSGYKGVMHENCYKCKGKLYSSTRGGVIYYKYCPKCGIENNVSLKIKNMKKFPSLEVSLSLICVVIIYITIYEEYVEHYYQLKDSLEILAFIGLIYLIVRLFYKACPHCGNGSCVRVHKYCYNCGKEI